MDESPGSTGTSSSAAGVGVGVITLPVAGAGLDGVHEFSKLPLNRCALDHDGVLRQGRGSIAQTCDYSKNADGS